MSEIRLITLDPGHFHAALVQKEMYPEISPRVSVYAPLSQDLVDHLERIARFNSRRENPTAWMLDVHAEPEFLDRMLAERPGNVVVLSGRNRAKIHYIQRAVAAGLNVLADKPWIIASKDLPALEASLRHAEENGLFAYDIMTERFEVTSMLQRELVNTPEVFGQVITGSVDEPGVAMESVHHIMKEVAGAPLKRPAWFFDIRQQGEGLSDVGTHLVDLVQWTLFPERKIDYRRDVEIHRGMRWPTVLTLEEFRRVTGEAEFPAYLEGAVANGKLEYFCNNQVSYSVKGIHVRLDVLWNYEAPAGSGDTHFAVYRGTRSRIEVRQTAAEGFRPELYVAPNSPQDLDEVFQAVRSRLMELSADYPGVGAERRNGEIQVVIPDRLRVGHEAHFAQVARQFFSYLQGHEPFPEWETPNMLAKYYVTTKGVELGRDPEDA